MATANAESRNGQGTKPPSDNGRKQRPVWTKNGFPLTIAAFEFPIGERTAKFQREAHAKFQRDENSEWENTEYLGGGDLLRAAKLLEAADAFVQSRLEAFHQSRKDRRQF